MQAAMAYKPCKFDKRRIFIVTAVVIILYSAVYLSYLNRDLIFSQRSAVHLNRDLIFSQRSDILFCTYMRSGSTFLGEVLGWRSDTFYWYEPLWKNYTMKYIREDGQTCDYIKPSCNNKDTSAADRALTLLSDIYSCIFANHDIDVYKDLHGTYEFTGPSWKIFYQCSKQKKTVKECLRALESSCRKATHRVTKVLRLDVSYTSQLLEKHPRLKVLLLLRDPRGIINSHITTEWFPLNLTEENALTNDIEVLCSRMRRDIAAFAVLKEKFGDRVKIVQYEDFGNSIESYRKIYKFTDMKLKANNTELLRNLTTSKSSTYGKKIQYGYNPYSYRRILDWNTTILMQKYCSDVYKSLGYINYRNESQMRNLSETAYKTKLPYSLD